MLRNTSIAELGMMKPFNLRRSDLATTQELLIYLPESIHSILPFLSGDFWNVNLDTPTNGLQHFIVTLIGVSEGTRTWNYKYKKAARDTIEVEGFLEKPNNLLQGDYYIHSLTTVYNLHFVNGERSGWTINPKARKESGNAIYIFDGPNYTIRETFDHENHVRTNIDDYFHRIKITKMLKNGVPFSIVRSDMDTQLMLSLTDTFGVNENASVPFAPSIPDNQENMLLRQLFGLEREDGNVSRLASRDHPLLKQLVGANKDGYTLLCFYTKEGVIHTSYITAAVSNDQMSNTTVLSQRLHRVLPEYPLIVNGIIQEPSLQRLVNERANLLYQMQQSPVLASLTNPVTALAYENQLSFGSFNQMPTTTYGEVVPWMY